MLHRPLKSNKKKTYSTLILLACCFSFSTFAQSSLNQFFKLSPPKRNWVLLHPFKAKKSLEISKEVQKVSDSIKKTNLLDGDASGGQVDAFRHAYWMARLKEEIGESAARSLGKAHEKENYLTFKNNELEDGILPDKASSDMDLWNNEQGLKLVSTNSKTPRKGLIFRIINAILSGKMKVLKKDAKGNFLDCKGNKIIKNPNQKKLINSKCLIASNKII